ncbi:uncharacterized protein LOC111467644 isoform X1 [Cucurbita maxima]|uniref:Uncharacterized protein LOC111467644 isoform X1 n=1 Tax=Cucurbita maxima TaxID=3661 RepID=A0A6J1HX20_CUCMA|nr:uncharacterized protein LOC111467644 isoform X1 [Cucurbita maxima]
MAMAAFKSSSRRGSSTSATPSSSSGVSTSVKDSKQNDNSLKKATMRRSRSVSAFPRSSTVDVSADFSNSRDNPLFWSNGSPPMEEARSVNLELDDSSARVRPGSSKRVSCGGVESTRGRSVSRNSDSGSVGLGNRKTGCRSLSRVGAERRDRSASVSRYTVSSQSVVNSESEAERESCYSTKSNGRKTPDSVLRGRREAGSVRSSSDALQQSKGLQTRSSQLSPFDLSDNCDVSVSCSFEDRLSTASSLSEAEEKTIRAVCEQMKSMKGDCLQGQSSASDIYDIIQYEVRRAVQDIHNDLLNASQSGADAVGSSNIDIPPELVNPGAVEMVMDLRSEYSKKLELSQDRARKLRADLAVEEQRGLELSRILREVIPAPKTSMRRKASIERRRMSKRLTDDALAYFDECVSLSTFDGSDFSSMEETPPPIHQVSSTTQVLDGTPQISHVECLQFQESATIETASESEQYNLGQTSYRSSKLSKSQFSFSNKPQETYGIIQQDIGKYIQKCEKDGNKSRVVSMKKQCDIIMNDRNMEKASESLLFDRLVFRNRIESGSILLCGVSSSATSSYYASII